MSEAAWYAHQGGVTRPSAASTTQLADRQLPRVKSAGSPAVLAPSTTRHEDSSGLTRRLAMALRLICMCGYVIQGDDDDELWRSLPRP